MFLFKQLSVERGASCGDFLTSIKTTNRDVMRLKLKNLHHS